MRTSTFALASIALAAGAAAQSGYGRFPCTIVNGDGSFSADPNQCLNANLVAPGAGDGASGNQGDDVTPVDPICTLETESGAYFCGIATAVCTTDANCDNGSCLVAAGATTGTCQGGFTQGCGGDDTNCSGYLYCLTPDFAVTATNQCGAIGAFCQDPVSVDPTLSVAAAQLIFNNFCSSGYCSSTSAACAVSAALGQSCADDPSFQCAAGLVCDTTTAPLAPVCVAAPVPSAGARTRRSAHAKKSLCPASHSACAVSGAKGFECIDVTSNLEQCGACASQGGADCTAIEGAESVGCVAGTCEIWSCLDGFTYSAATGTCVA